MPASQTIISKSIFRDDFVEKVGVGLPDPLLSTRSIVVVPAKNEEQALPSLIWALRNQVGLDGKPLPFDEFEIILLLNNCTDNTEEVSALLQEWYPQLNFHFLDRCGYSARARLDSPIEARNTRRG